MAAHFKCLLRTWQTESPPSQFGATIAWRDDDRYLLSPLQFDGKGLLVAQITGFAAELKYSDYRIWILGIFILTLAEAFSLSSAADDQLGIDDLPQNSPSQTWIGMAILKLPGDARLELALSLK